jgi:hypothetical protein
VRKPGATFFDRRAPRFSTGRHTERMACWDAEIEAQTYDRGFAAGLEARGEWRVDARYAS